MKVALGLDPGFAHFGYTLAHVYSREHVEVIEMDHIGTEKSGKKANVGGMSDDSHRTRTIIKRLDPLFAQADYVTAEAMSFVRNASTMAQIGRAWGAVDTLTELHQLPLTQVTPQALKIAVAGNKSASKDEIREALDKRFGYCLAEKHLRKVTRKDDREHPYDGLGSIIATLDHDVVRAILGR